MMVTWIMVVAGEVVTSGPILDLFGRYSWPRLLMLDFVVRKRMRGLWVYLLEQLKDGFISTEMEEAAREQG